MSGEDVRGGGKPNAKCGQRTVTVLVYLNDVGVGGRTMFRDLEGVDVKVSVGRGEKGRQLKQRLPWR